MTKSTTVWTACNACDRDTKHDILFSAEESEYDYRLDRIYQVVQCCGCTTKSFRKVIAYFEEAYQVDEDEWEVPKDISSYPAVLKGHRAVPDIARAPRLVSEIYTQSLDAIKNQSNVLAGIGLRATIEAICNERRVTGKNLEVRIDKLAKAGFISQNDADRLHAIRFLGNDAANAALETVNLGREQYAATHRPWIKVELKLVSDLKRGSDGRWRIDLVFKIKNVGNTPAQNVYPHPGFYAGEGFSDEVKHAQLELATKYKPIANTNQIGLTIFPGESSEIPIAIRVTKEFAENKDLIHIGFSDCLPRLFIVGSVHYKSTLGEISYRTGFIRSFEYFDAVTQKNTLIPKRDIISHSELRIGRHFSGNGYIN